MRTITRFVLLVILSVALIRPRIKAEAGDSSPDPQVIVVDASAPAHPFPHFWEKMFGSGRAILTLR